jgi:transposase
MAQRLGISRPTVAEDVRRAQAARLSWPWPATLDETALERLVVPPHAVGPLPSRPAPDWATGHHALKRQGGTVCLRWQEDKRTTPEGFQDSRCCQGDRAWTGTLDLVLRQSHCAGEQLFVDDAGQGLPVVHPRRGEVPEGAMFVAVLGASHDTYAEAP